MCLSEIRESKDKEKIRIAKRIPPRDFLRECTFAMLSCPYREFRKPSSMPERYSSYHLFLYIRVGTYMTKANMFSCRFSLLYNKQTCVVSGGAAGHTLHASRSPRFPFRRVQGSGKGLRRAFSLTRQSK